MSRKIRILAVGRNHEPTIVNAINEYETRLRSVLRVEWQLLPHGPSSKNERGVQIAAESDSIRRSLKNAEYVILLDDLGQQLTSEEFSGKLENLMTSNKAICFVIGGAHGVDEAIVKQVDFVWSLGKLTFPHQIVRLVLIEQIYRAISIFEGSNYHHGA